MFAVLKTGGKQYKVAAGDILKIEKLAGEAGAKIEFKDIFMVGDDENARVGAPLLEKASVKATVLEQARGDKIIVFKKKRRQGYDRKNGHRQDLTVVHIDEILEGGKSVAKAERKAKKVDSKSESKPAAKTVKEPAAKKAAPKKAPAKAAAKADDKAKDKPAKEAPKKVAAKKAAPKKAAEKKDSEK